MYACCKIVGGTPSGLWVGGWGSLPLMIIRFGTNL